MQKKIHFSILFIVAVALVGCSLRLETAERTFEWVKPRFGSSNSDEQLVHLPPKAAHARLAQQLAAVFDQGR